MNVKLPPLKPAKVKTPNKAGDYPKSGAKKG
jgi:hypothetical protein